MDSSKILTGVGVIAMSYATLRFLRFVYLYARASSLKKYRYGNEPWALVTGASDGIGFGFAQELALNGFNVVLHGRNPTKLEKGKSQLNQEFPNTKFRVVVADASDASNQQIQELVSSLSDIHLTILINNVGGGSVCKPLEDHVPREVDSMMNLNARFPIQITRALLSTFTKTSDPRLIMTIGSLGTSGVPYAVPYGGSKAFNMSMSASLDVEMRTEGKNVEVIGIPVGGVTEVGHRKDAATFFTPNGRTMARAALARVGCGRAVVIGYLGHAIQIFFLELLPRAVKESLVVPIMKRYKEEALRNK